MSNKILNKVNNDIFSYDSTGGVFKMSRVMPTEIHHVTGGAGTSGYILTSTGDGWSWTDPSTLSSGSGLTDTSLSNPQNGDILEYDSATQLWKNVTPSGLPQALGTTATPTFNSINFTLAGGATQYITRIGAFGITTNYLTVYNGFTNYSDDRIKSNEKLITNGTSIIKQLKPKIYDKHVNHRVPADKEDNDLSGIDYIKESGFVAQEVDTITDLKHLVSYDKSKDLYSLNYIGIIPYLVKSIQELEARIKTLESK